MREKTGWQWLDDLIDYAIANGSVAAIMAECKRCGKPIAPKEKCDCKTDSRT